MLHTLFIINIITSLDVNHSLLKVIIIDKYLFGRLEINELCSVCFLHVALPSTCRTSAGL